MTEKAVETTLSWEKLIELQAKVLCLAAGIEPVDPLDGSPNWWLFSDRAAKIVGDIRMHAYPVATHKRSDLLGVDDET